MPVTFYEQCGLQIDDNVESGALTVCPDVNTTYLL